MVHARGPPRKAAKQLMRSCRPLLTAPALEQAQSEISAGGDGCYAFELTRHSALWRSSAPKAQLRSCLPIDLSLGRMDADRPDQDAH